MEPETMEMAERLMRLGGIRDEMARLVDNALDLFPPGEHRKASKATPAHTVHGWYALMRHGMVELEITIDNMADDDREEAG